MIDFDWDLHILEDSIEFADCIELLVAFADTDYGGRFTPTNFRDIIVKDILELEDEDAIDEKLEEQISTYSRYFDDAKQLIGKRATWLGDNYPFATVRNTVVFSPSSSRKYLSYLLLLMCSRHTSIPSLDAKLTIDFEYLCKEAMRSLFPDWADVFLFSQFSDDRRQMGLPAKDAVPKLAAKLNVKPINASTLPNTREEYGVDLVAISAFDDELEYPFFAFGQCTVAKDWWVKKGEARYDHALNGVITLRTNHSNFLLIPHFPRTSATEWREHRGRQVTDCILCDRYRICRLLEKSGVVEHNQLPNRLLEVFQLIEESIRIT